MKNNQTKYIILNYEMEELPLLCHAREDGHLNFTITTRLPFFRPPPARG